MNCSKHLQNEANGVCIYCGKFFCDDCLIEVKGKMYCKDDIGNVMDEAKLATANSVPNITINNTNESSNVGQSIITNTNTPFPLIISSKSKPVCILLCCMGFFGFSGLHRFYTGKIFTGILYFSTCGFFHIGTIIDIVKLFSGTFTDSSGAYIRE
jgi:hypothetical protein